MWEIEWAPWKTWLCVFAGLFLAAVVFFMVKLWSHWDMSAEGKPHKKSGRRKQIADLQGVNKRLLAEIEILTTGDECSLTRRERQLILVAVQYGPFRELMEEPQTGKAARDAWKGVKEKIKLSLRGSGG
jgi:hypothetical protein